MNLENMIHKKKANTKGLILYDSTNMNQQANSREKDETLSGAEGRESWMTANSYRFLWGFWKCSQISDDGCVNQWL